MYLLVIIANIYHREYEKNVIMKALKNAKKTLFVLRGCIIFHNILFAYILPKA